MKRFWTFLNVALIALFVGLLAGAAQAAVVAVQTVGDISLDPDAWFASTAALAVQVGVIVALVRKHFWKSLDGFAVVIFSFILGVISGAFGHFFGFLDGGLAQALLFGAGGGLAASGGVQLVRDSIGGSTSTQTPPGSASLPR